MEPALKQNISEQVCERLKNGPQRYLDLNHWNVWILPSLAKETLQIRCKDRGVYPGFSKWTLHVNHECPCKRERLDYRRSKQHDHWSKMLHYSFRRRREKDARNAGTRALEVGKSTRRFLEPPEGDPDDTLFWPWKTDFTLVTSKMVTLWGFVRVITENTNNSIY